MAIAGKELGPATRSPLASPTGARSTHPGPVNPFPSRYFTTRPFDHARHYATSPPLLLPFPAVPPLSRRAVHTRKRERSGESLPIQPRCAAPFTPVTEH